MLEACPRCLYSLSGLPAEHACPECGLRYDEQSELWSVRWDRHGRAHGLWLILPVCAWIPFFVSHIINQGAGRWRVILVPVLMSVLILQGAISLYRAAKGCPRVAVLPDGLFVWQRLHQSELIPWSDIADARGNDIWGAARVYLKSGRRIHFAYEFRPRAQAAVFAKRVRERIKSIPNEASEVKPELCP